jgi:hypothetical protein
MRFIARIEKSDEEVRISKDALHLLFRFGLP